ncbi:glycosyltransferase family 8 protein [Methylobacter sp. Wu1]|uniref:glycosyltransferase family 8 protein n=1 Tax=Methylobacter sp. Wu1 TaxID=3119359 RepID=UPI002F93ACFD
MDLEKISYPIVLACDEAYAMPLATTLRSIVEANQNSWPLDFHVLANGLSDNTRRKVLNSLPKGSASIRWVPVDLELFRKFYTMSHVSKMTYARFVIPEIFPDSVSRVLYLDADILVLDDLGSLWETPLEGFIVGAVLDGMDSQIKRREPDLKDVPRVRDYFNAGILLIDLQRWRKEQISEKALEYLNLYPHSPYSDQDALNVACDGLWKKLDPRWNFQDYYEKQRLLDIIPEQRPGIVHFVWKSKPWNASMPNLNASFYDAFRSRTCFARTPLDKLLDTLQGYWHQLKGILRQYPFLRNIWNKIRGSVALAKRV